MNRQADINQTILRILNLCDGHALPQSTLREHLDTRLRPKVTDEEFREAIDWCNEQGLIKSLPGQFADPEPRWLISESGQVRLAQ